MGNLKGVGRIYQQIFIDTYAKVAMAKLYDRTNALVGAGLLNDRVLPFFEEHDLLSLENPLRSRLGILWQREYHEYQLYLSIEGIDHTKRRPSRRRPTESANGSSGPF